jgi:hypothetical protein
MQRVLNLPGSGVLTIREYGHWAPPARQDWHIPCVADNSRFEELLLADRNYLQFAEKLREEKLTLLEAEGLTKEAASEQVPSIESLAAELKAIKTLPPAPRGSHWS